MNPTQGSSQECYESDLIATSSIWLISEPLKQPYATAQVLSYDNLDRWLVGLSSSSTIQELIWECHEIARSRKSCTASCFDITPANAMLSKDVCTIERTEKPEKCCINERQLRQVKLSINLAGEEFACGFSPSTCTGVG